ncbi:MAG: hypothetical protein C4K58_06000 [Flavobacteriaceae bacterium]|nr:MAG: hypothetical protein C4K58_06000 [Flavobacteriaceae bacterium]
MCIRDRLNTGTFVGVFANIFCDGFPPNNVESFSWGGQRNANKFTFDKAMEVAQRMMERRGISLSEKQEKVYRHLFDNL